MQPLHALKTPFFVSYLTIVNTGIGNFDLLASWSSREHRQTPFIM